jgi:hypothetical protein
MTKQSRVREIQTAIARVLRDEWNPIGVSGLPADEYDSYVRGVYRLLANGADAHRVAAHLAQLEYVSMGLPERQIADLLAVANKLLDVQISVNNHGPAA